MSFAGKTVFFILTVFSLFLGLITPNLSTPTASALTVKPGADLSFQIRGGGNTYIAGQGLYLNGTLGTGGVRRIVVESHMNRPGDTWTALPGEEQFEGKTRADGSFRLPIQAPSMFNISYRVRGGTYVTPGITFNAKTQDVDLWVDGFGQPDYTRPVQPLSSQSFTIVADTAPKFYRRPTTTNLPILAGREVTLWEKESPSRWSKVATGYADNDGLVRFSGLSKPVAGTYIYRARQEDWTSNGSDVGWIASWPIEVRVRSVGELPTYLPEGDRTPGNVAGQRGPEAANPNAGARYNWHPFRWDFGWERGQDLDDPPTRGLDLSGRWREEATGLGRVVKHNGGLMVSSGKLVKDGRGDFGTTTAVVRGAAQSYGRWEALLSFAMGEKDFADYLSVMEVVPARAQDYDCGRHNITVASWKGLSRRMTFGVNSGSVKWSKSIRTAGVGYSIPAVAVEVGQGHITWFLNSKPIGTVRDKKAVPGVPMTLRLRLVGDDKEHNNSSLFSDWQRSYSLSAGKQVKVSTGLKKTSLSSCPD